MNTPERRRKSLVPCIWLDDDAEAAARLYAELFPNSRVLARSHYPSDGNNPSGKPPGSVLTVEVDLAGQPFTLLDGGPQFQPNPSVSFHVQVESADEVDRLAGALSDGGVLMPIGSYPWSRRYAWVKDRFGVTWQVFLVDEKPRETIVPALMYVGTKEGKAAAALELYTKVFGGRVTAREPFAEAEGPTTSLKQARCELLGQELVLMDGPGEHQFDFNEGISLQVLCEDQREIDRYWEALVEGGGEHGPCGWLKDPFGVSWQVTPRRATEWLTSSDTEARDRAFAAIMKMGKLDVAAIQAAFEGRSGS